MKITTPEISWHGKEPVLSVDFCKIGSTMRFASAGADNDVKMWQVFFNEEGNAKIEFLANLSRHNKAVNVVRFSPNEEMLASASDDGVIILWKLSMTQEQCAQPLRDKDDEIENRESWTVHKVLRGHIEDVYDLAWSPDGTQIISGSVDNSAIVWDVVKGVKLIILKDHKHYVQGVCWDPLGQYIVTNSSDRSCRLYSSQTYRYCYNINKLSGSANFKIPDGGELKQLKMFHDETLLSFFRRPSYTPDGSLLIIPAGRIDMSNKVLNATFVFTRGSPNKPVLCLPSPKKPTVAVRCCPLLFELKKKDEEIDKENEKEKPPSLFKLPYRMVFAVATLNSVLLYDTQHKIPFGYISNIHYSGLSDLTWSNDGKVLVISSTDGYCSIAQFKDGELGTPYEKTVKEVLDNYLDFNTSSLPSTPAQTPENSGKITKKVILTPVQQKMEIDSTPDSDRNPKKKDMPQIDKFAVPMSQIQTITPIKATVNKLTPRRVQLESTEQAGIKPVNVVAGTNQVDAQAMAGQTVLPRCVPLVTTNQAGQLASTDQAGMKPVNIVAGPNQVGQEMAGQTVLPKCVPLVTTNQAGQLALTGQAGMNPVNVVTGPNQVNGQEMAGQTVLPRRVLLVTTNQAGQLASTGQAGMKPVNVVAGPNQVGQATGQTVLPRHVPIVTTNQAGQLASTGQAGMKPVNVVTGLNQVNGQAMARQTVLPKCVLTTNQAGQLAPTDQAGMKLVNVVTGPNQVNGQALAGQTVLPRRVPIVTTNQAGQLASTGQAGQLSSTGQAGMKPVNIVSGPNQVGQASAGQTVLPRRVQLMTTNQTGQLASSGQPEMKPVNVIAGPSQGNKQAMAGQMAGQTSIPRCVELVYTSKAGPSLASVQSLVSNIPSATCNVVPVVGSTQSNGKMIVTGQPDQAMGIQLVALKQIEANSTHIPATGVINVPKQVTGQTLPVGGQTAQAKPRRIQLVSVPSGQTTVGPGQTAVRPGQTDIGHAQKDVSSPQTSVAPAKTAIILGQTAPTAVASSLGKQPVGLTSPSTAAPSVQRRIQLIPVPTVPQQKSSNVEYKASGSESNKLGSQNCPESIPEDSPTQQDLPGTMNNSVKSTQDNSSVKPVARRVELSSLSISDKPEYTSEKSNTTENKSVEKMEVNGRETKEKKRRIPLTTLIPKETIQNSNSSNKEISKKPIPLEPTIIVFD